MTGRKLAPAAQAQFLPFEGCHNFRSVAGWRTPEGRSIQAGNVYRADGLDRLTDADQRSLINLGITHVFDLRAAREKSEAPSRWPEGFAATIWADAESAAEANIMQVMAQASPQVAQFHEAMRSVYAHLPDELAEAVGAVADALLESADSTVLIHCSAGKDRTGFVTSALLHAVGIQPDDVLADFLLSNACFDAAVRRFNLNGRFDALEERAPGSVKALVGVDAQYLAASMQSIATRYGSFDLWLRQRVGIDDGKRAQLRDRLLA